MKRNNLRWPAPCCAHYSPPGKCPAGKRGDSRERDSLRWHLVESRYKGNLDGEERRSVEDAAIDSIGRVSSPSRFDDLSKMRLKV